MKMGKLTFFAGKMGAGKSTKSFDISRRSNAVWISEDEWLASVYPNRISTLDDYIHYSSTLKPQIKKLVQTILQTGTDVVMDYPANTVAQRDWFKSIFSEIEAPHELVYIDLPDAVCLKQIAKRRTENPERAKTDTIEMFEAVTKHFVEPSSLEGFNMVTIKYNQAGSSR
ncbi:AAA family ATPase [Microbulbifer spongiae]|uniref:ATP-binding protein n=1 Tax=Microbulbifer spongiae TaxID=2944933 RepID=A0ABY9EBM1_9GAMM|nr:ATP-binding protein [Microbulbifer sp. MI-G]WKD49855.1 ATP-binding protein [Microbulbifer sp. MI-G]